MPSVMGELNLTIHIKTNTVVSGWNPAIGTGDPNATAIAPQVSSVVRVMIGWLVSGAWMRDSFDDRYSLSYRRYHFGMQVAIS